MVLRFIGAVDDHEWRAVLQWTLTRADSFRIRMPDDVGPLSSGRSEAQALPDATVRPWSGMRNAVEVTGPLAIEARAFFADRECSLLSWVVDQKLWDYQLVSGRIVLLSVSDFTGLMLHSEWMSELQQHHLLEDFPQWDGDE